MLTSKKDFHPQMHTNGHEWKKHNYNSPPLFLWSTRPGAPGFVDNEFLGPIAATLATPKPLLVDCADFFANVTPQTAHPPRRDTITPATNCNQMVYVNDIKLPFTNLF
jgi:hypothetical protein